MLGLHELPLLLILGLELGDFLAKREDAVVDVARRSGGQRLAVSTFRGHSASRCRRQCRVQLNERFALQRVGVAPRLFAVRRCGGASVDDPLLLRIGDQRALRTLKISASLVDLALEEVARVRGGLVATLKSGVDEAVGDPVRDERSKLRRSGIVAELDELSVFRSNDLQPATNYICGRAQAL